MNVATFRGVLGIITVATVVVWALIGFGIGKMVDGIMRGEAGGILGLLVGGGFGYVIGTYVHGVAYTLLSINDHPEALRKDKS